MNPHFPEADPEVRWRRLAEQVEARPEILDTAIGNLDRWEAWGRVHPGPLREWRRRIDRAKASPEGLRELIDYLRAPNHESEPLKGCSPFIGLDVPAGLPS